MAWQFSPECNLPLASICLDGEWRFAVDPGLVGINNRIQWPGAPVYVIRLRIIHSYENNPYPCPWRYAPAR